MFIYTKKDLDNKQHLFGNYEGSCPSETDQELIFTDKDGNVVEVTDFSLINSQKLNVAIKDKDGNEHFIFGDVVKIKESTTKTVVDIVCWKPTKISYILDEEFNTDGLIVKTVDKDNNEIEDITKDCEITPKNGTVLDTLGRQQVKVTYKEFTKTFYIKVTEK